MASAALEKITRNGPQGFVTLAAACWMYVGAVAEGMRKISYAGYRFPLAGRRERHNSPQAKAVIQRVVQKGAEPLARSCKTYSAKKLP